MLQTNVYEQQSASLTHTCCCVCAAMQKGLPCSLVAAVASPMLGAGRGHLLHTQMACHDASDIDRGQWRPARAMRKELKI